MSMSSANKEMSLGNIGDIKLSSVPEVKDCRPGIRITEYNVVIAPAIVEEKLGSILLADESKDRLKDSAQLGRLVAVSPVAFNYEHWPVDEYPPQVGDIVWYARFAGAPFTGADGKVYRIVKDKDIIGSIEIDEPEVKALPTIECDVISISNITLTEEQLTILHNEVIKGGV